MESFREKCLDKNYLNECPIDGRLCSEIKECPQGEKEVLRNYNERMRGKTEVSKSTLGKIKFGKYEGKEWVDVPEKYLEFLIKPECYTSVENKAIAKRVLDEKKVCDKQLELEALKK